MSTIYKRAEMPWMERLTWTGIAMHAGDLPGYPDSHGCVRLPLEFSKLLYTVTTKGGTVIIADQHVRAARNNSPGDVFSQTTPPATDAALAPGQFTWTPDKSASGPVTILVLGTGQGGLCLSQRRRNRTLHDKKRRDQRRAHL